MEAFFDYVAGDTGAFRLVFESDLTNEPAVREQVERVTTECAEMIADVIHDDTGLPDEAVAAARGLPGGNGPGQRAVLAHRGRRHQQGRRRRPGRRARLARHPRLPAHRRPLTPRRATADHRDNPDVTRRTSVEVKIGVQHAARELVVETDESAENVEKLVAEAVAPRACSPSPTARAAGSSCPPPSSPTSRSAAASPATVGFRS